MKNLFENGVEIRMEEGAKLSYSNCLNSMKNDSDDLSKRILEERARKASMTGKELLQEYRQQTEMKYMKKENARRIVEFMKQNHICEEDKKVFSKILGDHKILSKLVWVWDGSHRNNRIFFKRFDFDDMTQTALGIEDELYPYEKDSHGWNLYNKVDSITRLNHMKNNYEVIFIDLVSDAKSYEQSLYDLDISYDYDDDYDYDDYYDDDEAI